MGHYDYERLLIKPAANDVDRPWPPAAEKRAPDPSGSCRGDGGSDTPSDGGERMAA